MTKHDSTDRDHPARAAAVAMLAKGLATLSEVAHLADVSRQLVRHWAKRADIDAPTVREARLQQMWRKQMGRQKR